MALTVETGAGLADADAYEDEAATATRLLGLGLSSFDGLDPAIQETTVRRSTLDVDEMIRSFASGHISTEGQSLVFPRRNSYAPERVLDVDEIPVEIKRAAAYRAEDRASGAAADGEIGGIESEAAEDIKIDYSSAGSVSAFRRQSPDASRAINSLREVGLIL